MSQSDAQDYELLVGKVCFRICLHLIASYKLTSNEASSLVNKAMKECGVGVTVTIAPDESVVERFD